MLFVLYKKSFLYIFLLTLIAGPFLILSFYCHPLPGDDYHYAVRSIQIGPWNTLVESYVSWTGRYFLCGILSVNPLILESLSSFQSSLFLLILAFPISAYILVRTFLKSINTVQHIQCTALLSFLYFYSLPNVNEGLFWYTGAVAYQLANVLWMVYLVMVALILQQKNKGILITTAMVLSSVILIFMIAGCNEISMAVLLLFNCLLSLRLFITKSKNKYLFILLLLSSIISAFIVVAAPGNAIRTSLFPDNHNFIITIYMSLLGAGYYLMQWLFIVIIMSIFVIYVFNKSLPINNSVFDVSPRLSLTLLVLLLAAAFVVPAWATGQMPNPRAINVVFQFFIIGWFYNLLVFMNYYHRKGIHIPVLTRNYMFAIVSIVFLITFNPGKLVNNNIKYAYIAILSGKATSYSKQMHEYQEMVGKSKEKEIVYPAIKDKPYCLYNEIGIDTVAIKEMHLYYSLKNK